jgi:hypothetical protein
MKIYRSQKYREWIARQACLKCGFGPCHAHHEPLSENMVAGKAPDTHCVPLCPSCHDLRHNTGVDTFWRAFDVKMAIIKLITRYLLERGNA